MMAHNEKIFNEVFGVGEWVVKAKNTERVLDTHKVTDYWKGQGTKNGHTFYDEYHFKMDDEYLVVTARYVKSCKAWKVVHTQLTKKFDK